MEENRSNSAIGTFFAPSSDMTERLRTILTANSEIPVSFDDATEIGIQLVSLYECLARDRDNAKSGGENGQHR